MGTDTKKIFPRVMLIATIAVLLAGVAACCYFKKEEVTPEKKNADAYTAKLLLESLAHGALHYSAQNGGNGKKNFAKTPFEIKKSLPPIVARAVVGCSETLEHSDGYLCRQIPSDNPRNFYFEAYPAPGYSGKIFVIDISMKVQEKTAAQLIAEQKQITTPATPPPTKVETSPTAPATPPSTKVEPPKVQIRVQNIVAAGKDLYKKTRETIGDMVNPPPPPPPPIRDANPDNAKELLESVYYGALHYSVQNGGNGKRNFPTKPTQIMNSIPPIIKNAIVFLRDEEHKAVPVGGYIIAMYPAKSQNPTDDFCFVAYPAKYFRGPHFEIDKTGKIKKISSYEENEK